MNPLISYIIVFFFSCACAIGVTPLVRVLAFKMGAVDYPNKPRKIHTQPTPLWGGLAIFISWFMAVACAAIVGWLTFTEAELTLVAALLFAAALLVFGGMIDDRFSTPWWQQLVFPLAAALIMLRSGLAITFVTNPFGEGVVNLGTWALPLGMASIPIAAILLFVWLVGMTYTTKLVDGIDGLASSLALVSAAIIFGVSLSWDEALSPTSFLAATLAGSLVGFLYWNKFPARIFLGEGGSTLLGFGIAVMAVLSGSKIATALLLMGVPILDVAWIVLRRLMTGQSIYQGDGLHLHFRLLKAGMTQPQIVWFYAFVALAFGSISLFFTTRAKLIGLAVLVICMIVLAVYLVKRYGRTTSL